MEREKLNILVIDDSRFVIDKFGLLEYSGVFPIQGSYPLNIIVYDHAGKSGCFP